MNIVRSILLLLLTSEVLASDIPQVRFIDEHIEAVWKEEGLKPTEATEPEWCRRLYLDVLGRIPTIEELDRHLENRSPRKREELVNLLLGDEYADEYSRNWTEIWTVLLIGRDASNEFVNRDGMRQYLRRTFSKNKKYDDFVEELITANGSNVNNGDGSFNGAVNFLSGKMEENGVQATAKTAQLFLGMRIQCSQCHDHPFFSPKQNAFWELNSFFRQTVVLKRYGGTLKVQSIELDDQDFEGETSGEGEIYYEKRNGLKKVAYPVFVDGTKIAKSGYLADSHRRKQLASLIKASPYMPMAIVNRMWAHFLGYGFTKPVDDFDKENPPAYPELLEGLGSKFRESSFDMKELIRWIVLSKPYGLSSKANKTNYRDDPSLGEKPRFSRFYARQMTAEQVYQSLLASTEAGKNEEPGKKDEWLSQFIIAFGTDEGDDATVFNGSIPQVLTMFNGELTRKSMDNNGLLEEVANKDCGNMKKIEILYKAAISRSPSSAEIKRLQSIKTNAKEALQDLWWALINSNEFIIIH